MASNNPQQSVTVETLLDKEFHDFADITRRLKPLEVFVEELDRVTSGKPFIILNDIVWIMSLDCRDMLVSHLSEWAQRLHHAGGLFGQLQAHHVCDLPAKRPRPTVPKLDPYGERLADEHHEIAYKRLFPASNGARPAQQDFCMLKCAFEQTVEPLRRDRNLNRVHLYGGKKKGSSKMLSLEEVHSTALYAESVLNDLGTVARAKVGSSSATAVDEKATARDLVDLLLLGTSARMKVVMKAQDRESFYKMLHDKHDTLPPGSSVLFND
jgi:hypothetical protein